MIQTLNAMRLSYLDMNENNYYDQLDLCRSSLKTKSKVRVDSKIDQCKLTLLHFQVNSLVEFYNYNDD